MDTDAEITFVVMLLAVVVVTLIIGNPISIVGVGERGVKVTLGKTSSTVYEEGLHFKAPFISKIHNINVKTTKVTSNFDTYTKDIQPAKIEYVMNYNIQPDNVIKLYREYNNDFITSILVPTVESTLKDSVGKWTAQDLVAHRAEVANDVLTLLQQKLKNNYVNVSAFSMTNIDYSDTFEKAIEAKVVAEQRALEAKNKTAQVQEEAKQRLINAESEAKSMAIRANALTQNKALVQYEAVKKWDGKLPTYMMGNSVPFINLQGAN